MSLSAREQQALESIKDGLTGSDPELVALLVTFTRLVAGEEMPAREKIRARWRGNTRHSRRNRRRPRRDRGKARRLYQRLGFKRVALLLWLLIAISLIAAGVSLSRGVSQGSQSGCPESWAAFCADSAPADSSRPAAHETSAGRTAQRP